ncbi:MAG TPA: response regulator, partial [Bryobacteraceae bacterium]|nr:response regulator [Bryobacteraceae bacterium]
FLERWTAALNSGATFEMELRLRNSEGAYCWHLCRALPQRQSDGTVTRWTGVCTNIDAQKRSEKTLHQAAKMESIGVLAGGIAHDFNNLLTGVIGNTTLALEILGESDPTAPMLSSAVQAAQSAAHLTRQLLAYAGKGHFVSRRIQMAELIETTVALMRSSIGPGVQFHVQAAEDLPFIDADPLQVQQIAMNVIMNAAESIPQGTNGTVDITIETRHLSGHSIADENHRFAIEPGDFISLVITDSGAGMTPATLSRIFEPFFTTKFTGRGLGLAAAIGIVRSYKGAILARSEFGRGSRFEILLPASRTDQADSGKPDTAIALEKRGTVLVVDDQETVRSVAHRMLKAEGFEVLMAENGARAIEIFSARPSDISVVLLDLTMPGMSGSEVLSHLRKIDPAVRVILSSGFDKSAVLTQFAPEELAGFLQKPFTTRQIMEQIAKALQS